LARQRQDGKHQKILEAAVKVFAQKGFFNAKVSEIAKEARVADGTIYLYFKNKDDILIHLFEEEMEKIIRGMRERLRASADPVEKLKIFIRTHLGLVESNPAMAEVIQVELRQSNKFMKDYDNRRFHEYLNILAEIVREGQQKGLIRQNILPSVAKRVIFGALDEMSTYWVFSKRRSKVLEEVAAQVCEILIRGLAEGSSSMAAEAAASGN
jgi:TetR/AcrR family fatty acid metabolism transcriptional regulator